MNIATTKINQVWVEMPLGSSDSRLSMDINSLRFMLGPVFIFLVLRIFNSLSKFFVW